MRLIGLLIFATFLSQAQAADLECARRVSANRTHFALINVWPLMNVQTGREDCTGVPGFQFCVTNRDEALVDRDSVCGHRMNQRRDCENREWREGWTHVIEARCARGVRARIEVRRDGQGKLTCTRRGAVEKTVRLGECN